MTQPTANDILKKAVTPVAVTPTPVKTPVKTPVAAAPVKTPVAAAPVKTPVAAAPVVNKTPSAIANLITSGRYAAQPITDAISNSPLVSNFQTPAIPTETSPALAAKVKSYYDKGLDVEGKALPSATERTMDAVLQAPQNISAAYTKGYKAIGDSMGGAAGDVTKAVPTVLDVGIPALAGGNILLGGKGAGFVSGLMGWGVKGTARLAGGVAGAEHTATKASDSGSVGDFLIDAYKNKAESYKAARDTSLGVPGAKPLPKQLHDEGFAKNAAYQAARSAVLFPARAIAKGVSLLPENWGVTKQATAVEKGLAAIPDAPNYEGQGHLARLGTAFASGQLFNKGAEGVVDRVSQTFSNIGEDIATEQQNIGVAGDRIYSKFMNPNNELPMYKESSAVPVDFTDTGGKARALKQEAVVEAVQDKAEDKADIAPPPKDPLKDFEAQAENLTGSSVSDKDLEIQSATNKRVSAQAEQKGLEDALVANPSDESLIERKAVADAAAEKAASEVARLKDERQKLPEYKENQAYYTQLRNAAAKSVPASMFVRGQYEGMKQAEKDYATANEEYESADAAGNVTEAVRSKRNAALKNMNAYAEAAKKNPEIAAYVANVKAATNKYMALDAQADAEKAMQVSKDDPLNVAKKAQADQMASDAKAAQAQVTAAKPVTATVAPATVKPVTATVAPATVKPATVKPVTATVAPATVKPVTATVAPATVKPVTATVAPVAPVAKPVAKPAASGATAELLADGGVKKTVKNGETSYEGKGLSISLPNEAKNEMFANGRDDGAQYLENRLRKGLLTPKQYEAALAKGGALKTKGGTFSVMSTTVADKAPEAPAAAPDPYAAIIQQLTNQMNDTGQDFASRRKAIGAKAMLKDVLAQREQSLDRAQKESQFQQAAAERATEFDYRKGRDTTGDAKYEAERQHVYSREDLSDKEKAAAVARLEEQKQYERGIHKDETAYARGQDSKNLARQSKLDDAALLQTKMNVYKDVQAMKNQGIQGNSVAAQAFQDAKARADANPNDVAAKVTMDQLRSGFPDVVKRFDVTIVPDPKAAPAEYERQVAAANEQAASRNEAKQNATRTSTFSALKGSTPEITQARERAFQVEKNRLNLEIEKEMAARRDVAKENLKKANPGVSDAKLEQEAAKQVAAKFGADFAMRKARVNSVALNKAMDKDINTVYTLAGLKTTPVQKTILEAE